MLQTISGKGGKTRISSVVSLVSRGNLGLFLQAHQVPLQSGRHCQGCLPFGNFISCGLISCLHVPIFVLFFIINFSKKFVCIVPSHYCPLPAECLRTSPTPILIPKFCYRGHCSCKYNLAIRNDKPFLVWMCVKPVLNKAWINIWKYSPLALLLQFCHV